MIANNRRLLAWAVETQEASQAAIGRAEETLANIMETRIRLAHARLRVLNGLPAELT